MLVHVMTFCYHYMQKLKRKEKEEEKRVRVRVRVSTNDTRLRPTARTPAITYHPRAHIPY